MSRAEKQKIILVRITLDAIRDGSIGEFIQSPAFKHVLKNSGGTTTEYGREVARALVKKDEAESKEIADEMDVKEKHVRRVLEELYERGVVNRRRTEDSETGWISYRWSLEPERLLKRVEREKRELLRETREEVQRERETVFFACEDSCARVEYGRAMELGFECPKCGRGLHESDSNEVISSLEERVEKLEGELEDIPKRKAENG